MPRTTPVPPAFLDRMQPLLGDELAAFADSLSQPPVAGLRANTGKTTIERIRAVCGLVLEPVPWCADGFTVQGEDRPGKHPWHAAGAYYLQEPSAMVAAELLAPEPGERVLDLCASPGGKATHISARMRDEGLLVANDVLLSRAQTLAGNLERWGARNCIVTAETPQRLAERWPGLFDRVLVDAPCSEEGMFRRSEAARAAWSPRAVAGCAARQREILRCAATMVRPGGRLVYSTCTFGPEENEGVVLGFLREQPDFQLEEAPSRPGFSPGRPDWLAEADRTSHHLERSVRLWPQRVRGEGHYCAVMRRANAPTGVLRDRRPPLARLASDKRRDLEAFWRATLTTDLPPDLVLTGDQLYAAPDRCPDLTGLRVLRPGWWLGRFPTGRFEPSHSLALGLRSTSESRRTVDLDADDPSTLAYLRGEMLSAPGPDGWILVSCAGLPLGWGKRTAGRVKNLYPKGLRRP